jgi:hypothetical protein
VSGQLSERRIFLMNEKLYRLEAISEHRAQVICRDAVTNDRVVISTTRYYRDKRSVWTMGQIAKFFNLDRARIRDWMLWTEFPAYTIEYAARKGNPVSERNYRKYYSKPQVEALYDMIVRLYTKGKVTKDKFKTPYYNLPTKAELLGLLNESDVYYVKRGENYVPIFRPDWT